VIGSAEVSFFLAFAPLREVLCAIALKTFA